MLHWLGVDLMLWTRRRLVFFSFFLAGAHRSQDREQERQAARQARTMTGLIIRRFNDFHPPAAQRPRIDSNAHCTVGNCGGATGRSSSFGTGQTRPREEALATVATRCRTTGTAAAHHPSIS